MSTYWINNDYLMVPSDQIGSAWEWYHWIGLEKDINLYRFLIFWNQSFEYSKRLAHFYLLKKSAKGMLYFGLDCGMLEHSTHEP